MIAPMKTTKRTKKRGPKEDRLNFNVDWELAVSRALEKKRLRKEWPEPIKKKIDSEG